jgi:metallo-beta-lactamase class B
MKRKALVGMSLILAWTAIAAAVEAADDPLTRPIEPEFAQRWLTPQPATHIHGNLWLIGFGGLNVALIKTSEGLILIDGAVPQSVRALEANIRAAGFDIKQVKLILSTEPHYDHAGGIAALARDSGATVVASAAAAKVFESGLPSAEDPQHAWLPPFPAVKTLRIAQDGEPITLGDVTVTAVATPGHTAGSMSWQWESCEGQACKTVVFASSLNPVAAPGYRFSAPEHRGWVKSFRQTAAKVRALRCDLLLSAHPDQSGGDAKLAAFLKAPAPNPFIDPQACRGYADKFEALLDGKLADEAKAPAAK